MLNIHKCDVAIVGLGVMGQSLSLNLVEKGYRVAGFDIDIEKRQSWQARAQREFSQDVASRSAIVSDSVLETLSMTESPRIIIVMVPAGDIVDSVIDQLLANGLDEDDVVVDCGNSNWQDTVRREQIHKGKFHFFTTAVSGGEEGARFGPSLMPSGDSLAWDRVKPIWRAIAAKVDINGKPMDSNQNDLTGSEPCVEYLGSGAAGHYIKMVHNGIEYADMQLICEAYWLLREVAGYTPAQVGRVFERWNEGVLQSYLIEISADILTVMDKRTGMPLVDVISDQAGQNGTGRWTSINATHIGAPAGIISEAVYARALSSLSAQRQQAKALLHANTIKCEIDPDVLEKQLEQALYSAKICAYAQGFQILKMAKKEHDWTFNFADIARIWRGGCIIRASFLQSVSAAYKNNPTLDCLILSPFFRETLDGPITQLRQTVALAAQSGVATPALYSALAFFDGYRTSPSAISLLQAQRDYFGAHSYQRVDAPLNQRFHTLWQSEERTEILL